MQLGAARDFLLKYLQQSYQTDLLGLSKDPGYQEAWIPTTKHWLKASNGHPRVWPDADDQKRQAQLANRVRQRLFRLSRYAHPTYGSIARAVVSARDADWGAPGYHVRWDLAEVDGVPKIIAEDSFCTGCAGVGRIPEGRPGAGDSCPDCTGDGWTFVRGVRHPTLGAPLEVLRLEDPVNARHLAAHRLER